MMSKILKQKEKPPVDTVVIAKELKECCYILLSYHTLSWFSNNKRVDIEFQNAILLHNLITKLETIHYFTKIRRGIYNTFSLEYFSFLQIFEELWVNYADLHLRILSETLFLAWA